MKTLLFGTPDVTGCCQAAANLSDTGDIPFCDIIFYSCSSFLKYDQFISKILSQFLYEFRSLGKNEQKLVFFTEQRSFPCSQVLQKKLEVLVLEVSGLGRSRLTSVQQLSRGLQHDEQACRRDNGLSRLWEELESSIRSREQV